MAEPYDAIVLAGGSARRLGGVDKVALVVAGRSLLDRVLAAVADADRVVAVGPARTTAAPVTWTLEEPPGGGPVAALAAGLLLTQAPVVAVLAADLPFLDAATLRVLRDALGSRDGALLVDADNRDQLLVGVWRATSLRTALPEAADGARLGAVLAALDAVRVRVEGHPWFDCDTDDALAEARRLGPASP